MMSIETKKKETIKLFKDGVTQTVIAKKLSVQECSVSKWVKELKKETKQYKGLREKLIKRLDNVLDDTSSTSTDIHNITNALSSINNKIKTL